MSRIVGIDLGGSKLSAIAVEPETWQMPLARARRPLPSTVEGLVGAIANLFDDVAVGDAVGLGLGVAGLVDPESGVLVSAPHLPGRDVDLAALLSDRLEVRVAVLNDADAAALAELKGGAARSRANAIVLTIGTGIGCGLIIDRRVHRGRGFAGEPGHMPIEAAGDLCPCGRRGCWETLVSGRILDRRAADLGVGSSTADLVGAASDGDDRAVRVLDEAGRWLGRGLAVITAVLDPEMFVIGGGVAAAGELLLDPARAELSRWSEAQPGRRQTPVVPAQFGADAGAIGAALNWWLSANPAPDLI